MSPAVVWAAALVIAFALTLGVIFKALSEPPSSYVVNPQRCTPPPFAKAPPLPKPSSGPYETVRRG